MHRLIHLALLWLTLCPVPAAMAQSSAAADATGATFSAGEITAFAKQVERAVAERGARVFIAARKGRAAAELPEGIEYTHTALGVYSAITLDDGRTVPGYAMYNLYQRPDDLGASRIVIDYPAQFYAGAFQLTTAVVIPTPELQARLLEAVSSGVFQAVHNPRYSAISNPFDRRFQNCTEHLLDVINASIYDTTDRTRLKQYARDWFKPQKVKVGGLRLLLGGLFKDDVAISDHRGAAHTATFGAISDYLRTHGLVQSAFVLSANMAPTAL